jgi:hypothetical protein
MERKRENHSKGKLASLLKLKEQAGTVSIPETEDQKGAGAAPEQGTAP